MRVFSKNISIFFIGIILALTIISVCLLFENRSYQKQNRQLVIQNDSILSVNIELRKYLQKEATSPVKTLTTGFNKEKP